MWAFPPGGVPPEVVGPDVLPIPPDVGGNPTPTPPSPARPRPRPRSSPSDGSRAPPEPTPSGPRPPGRSSAFEPGDLTVLAAREMAPVGGGALGAIDLFPVFDICLFNPTLPGCPTGLPATFPAGDIPILQFPFSPTITVVFVDSDRANEVMVGYTVDPPGTRREVLGPGPEPGRGPARVGDELARDPRDDHDDGQARRAGRDDLRLPGHRR